MAGRTLGCVRSFPGGARYVPVSEREYGGVPATAGSGPHLRTTKKAAAKDETAAAKRGARAEALSHTATVGGSTPSAVPVHAPMPVPTSHM